ncbi:MAG: gluconokinase [Anaerolineae bacterium]
MSILVVDIGSSSVRALLFDEQAKPIPGALCQIKHSFHTAGDGEATADPRHLQQLTEECITQVVQHPAASDIQAVGVSSFVGNILGVDASGSAVTPCFTYADGRGGELVKTLQDKIDVPTNYQATGCRLHPAYATVRLYWYQQQYPEAYRRVARWMDFAAYLYRQWFGQTVTSYSVASWSGLLNRAQLAWDDRWLNLLQLDPAALPTLADTMDTVQGLLPPYNERWQVLADVPFFLAIGDGAAANIGSGGVDSTSAALSIGSTSAIRRVSTDRLPPVPDGLWGYRVTAQHPLIGGATTEGGTLYEWARKTLQLEADVEAALAAQVPDGHGLTVLPFWSGERSPGWHSEASGTLHGLRLSTTPLDILHALLESIALRLAHIAGVLLPGEARIMAGGGAIAASTVWPQIIANALNRPLHMLSEGETSARGIAILLLSHLHQRQWTDYPPQIARVIQPQRSAVEIYQQARQRQQALYQQFYKG